MNEQKKLNKIQMAILQTLHFYDLFQFPLTNMEIYQYLWRCQCELVDLLPEIDDLKQRGLIGFGDGFYYLRGRENSTTIRKKRYLASYHKWRIARKYRWVFRLVPWLKMVGISNTLAYGNAKPDGDIDILVIPERKRLFLVRTIMTALLLPLGKWRWRSRIKDRFCLSFFLDEDSLDLSQLKLDHDDIYLTYWTAWLKSLHVRDKNLLQRYAERNRWVTADLPNLHWELFDKDFDDSQTRPYFTVNWIEWILGGRLGDFCEDILAKMQLAKIKNQTPLFLLDGKMATRKILKFHPVGKRQEYYEKWLSSINDLS